MRISHIHVILQGLLDLIMGSTIVKCAVADLGIQWAGWAVAAAFKTEKFYDLAGKFSLGFVAVYIFVTTSWCFVVVVILTHSSHLFEKKCKQRQYINPQCYTILNYELVCQCYKMRIM